jgi:carboxypeptidase Taq
MLRNIMRDNHSRQFEALRQHAQEIALLGSVGSILEWDERTYMPAAASAYRAEQVAHLAGLVHARWLDPRFGELIEALAASPLAADGAGDTGCTIRDLRRLWLKKTRLPQRLVEEIARTAILGQQTWIVARRDNDFLALRPILDKLFRLKREEADALAQGANRYDPLLDDYEPGQSSDEVAQVFAGLRDELVGLIQRFAAAPRRPDVSILFRSYPVDGQEQFARRVAEDIGFDFQRGRLDRTAHPFCTQLGPHDVRLTTRYNVHDFSDGFFGVLHEAGHGLYEQGLPQEEFGLPLGEPASLGIHESQSRLWENLVGRSRAFWDYYFEPARGVFAGALGEVDIDTFHFAVNDVRPSLIRTEADEVTYNVHVFIRFELEQALLEGDLPVADLPAVWNEKYRAYLGIEPPNDASGVLQDIHWSAGAVGYFPTYTLGNLYAAQFFEQAELEIGPLEAHFRRGHFQPLLAWLRDKIHRHGRRYGASDLARRVTGRPLSHEPLVRHLKRKFEPLYGLS